MDAVGSQRAAVMGISEGGIMATLFAATYPERTSALILYGSHETGNNPASTEAEWVEYAEGVTHNWGSEAEARDLLSWLAPSLAMDEQLIQWAQKFMRLGASPGAVTALARMNSELDVRHILPSIHVPTLVLHRRDDKISVRHGRYLAEHIPGARFVEFAGADHLLSIGNSNAILDEIEEFLTGVRHPPEHDRMLATIMFTDIVSSTERAHELGDRKWLELMDQHNALVREELARFRGVEMNTTGDGFFAIFDGPARAIRCALAISDRVEQLGIQIRAGLHTGECEMIGNKVGGIAVHIGARVMAYSGANEVLVSSTVKDLVAGSGIRFVERGVYELKGVPDEWHLYTVMR